jgi:hypothetical protein
MQSSRGGKTGVIALDPANTTGRPISRKMRRLGLQKMRPQPTDTPKERSQLTRRLVFPLIARPAPVPDQRDDCP